MTNEARWMVRRRWESGAVQYLATNGASHAMQMFVADESKAGLFSSFVEAERVFSRWLEITVAKNPHPWLGTGEVELVRLGPVQKDLAA